MYENFYLSEFFEIVSVSIDCITILWNSWILSSPLHTFCCEIKNIWMEFLNFMTSIIYFLNENRFQWKTKLYHSEAVYVILKHEIVLWLRPYLHSIWGMQHYRMKPSKKDIWINFKCRSVFGFNFERSSFISLVFVKNLKFTA